MLTLAQAAPKLLSWPAYAKKNMANPKNMNNIMHCDLVHLMYVDAKDLQDIIYNKHQLWVSAEGSTQWLLNKHDLIICDDLLHRKKLEKLLSQINHPPTQIKIHAKIISIDKNDLHDLGANLLSNISSKSDQQASDSGSGDLSKNGLKIVLGSLYAQQLLSIQLHALVQNGHAKVIANPSLLTSDGVSANIESGEEVPYQQGALSGGTSISFKKAVMQLAVTPQITSSKTVRLKIQVHQDKVTAATVNGVPIISTEQLATSAVINKGNTLLLGGIIEKQTSDQREGVPVLRHIPIIGLLFQRHRKEVKNKVLLIMIQPSW